MFYCVLPRDVHLRPAGSGCGGGECEAEPSPQDLLVASLARLACTDPMPAPLLQAHTSSCAAAAAGSSGQDHAALALRPWSLLQPLLGPHVLAACSRLQQLAGVLAAAAAAAASHPGCQPQHGSGSDCDQSHSYHHRQRGQHVSAPMQPTAVAVAGPQHHPPHHLHQHHPNGSCCTGGATHHTGNVDLNLDLGRRVAAAAAAVVRLTSLLAFLPAAGACAHAVSH